MTLTSSRPAFVVVPLLGALALGAACSAEPAETFGAAGSTSMGGSPMGSAGSQPVTTAGTGLITGGVSSTAGAAGTATGGIGGGGTGGGGGNPGTAGSGGSATAGSGGTGGSGPCETLDCVVGGKNDNQDAFSSSFFIFGCYDKAGQDCITIPAGGVCPAANGNLPFEQQGLTFTQKFKVGGVDDKHYLVSITVNGITEAKYYEKGMRAAGEGDPPNPDAVNGTDTFYTGGQPVNFENYNVYKITTKDKAGTEIQHYYLNSFPKTNTPYEHHQTFPIGFTHDIEVAGGGSVELLQADRNCHAIDNCGIGFRTTSCAQTDGRSVPNEPNLMLPMSYLGKKTADLNLFGGTSQPFHSQVIHITAKAVTPK